jgi:hypothetical protein
MGSKGRNLLVITALFAAFSAPSAAAPAPTAACGANEVTLYTLEVTGKPLKRVYHVGDIVEIAVRVVRYADHDPATGEQPVPWPTAREPAPDVEVGGGVNIGDTYFYGYTLTDENGEGTMQIEIQDYADTGTAYGYLSAWKYIFRGPGDCPSVIERGYGEIRPRFKVKE